MVIFSMWCWDTLSQEKLIFVVVYSYGEAIVIKGIKWKRDRDESLLLDTFCLVECLFIIEPHYMCTHIGDRETQRICLSYILLQQRMCQEKEKKNCDFNFPKKKPYSLWCHLVEEAMETNKSISPYRELRFCQRVRLKTLGNLSNLRYSVNQLEPRMVFHIDIYIRRHMSLVLYCSLLCKAF